ncbi:uncharacterized protein LOC141790039 [Halichoeres trimaculatus]|uniref:uncharacterized protein LOC141790039 n=1 Tax=Halichoeres trimaculatus TaxID=147232 RepID=UPI003D9EB9BD
MPIIFTHLSRVMKSSDAGVLRVACIWMLILMHGLHAPVNAAKTSCRLREMTALTKSLVQESMIRFDKANGKHLGTWSPGFPILHVDKNASLIGPEAQCSLLFMAHGLNRVLQDQKTNLNPGDVPLHQKLKETINRVNMLVVCVKTTFGGECTSKPSPPEMPNHVFERKQWSHTLLKSAKDYLDWMESKTEVQTPLNGEKNKIKRVVSNAAAKKMDKINRSHQNYLEGSGYFL